MKKTLAIIGWITIVLSIALFIMLLIAGNANLISVLQVTVPGAFFGICTLWMSEVLEHLENMDDNTTYKGIASEEILKEQDETFWKCPRCGKKNPPYTGTCSCGCEKK